MARPGLRNAVVFSTFAALLALLLRSLRSAPLPSSSIPNGGSAPSTTMAPATESSTVAPAPVADTLPEREDGAASGPAAPQADGAPRRAAERTPVAEPAPVADTLPGLGATDALVADGEPDVAATAKEIGDWIVAADDDPPATHPVKAKLASGIYHVAGGASYDRTKPDRWYRSAEAAEADGLRPAKR